MNTVNVIDPKELVSAFFNDYKEEIDNFSNCYSKEVLEFCEGIADCHKKHNRFSTISSPSDRSEYVAAYVQVMINNLYTSMQLLMIEHLIPSGNMYRQSIEAACVAILLSYPKEILTGNMKKNPKKTDYFDSYMKDKPVAFPHKAVQHVWNTAKMLELREESIERLKKRKKFLDRFSHPSKLAMGLSQSGGEESKWFLGGGIGHPESDILAKEVAFRNEYVGILPELIEQLYNRVKNA